MDYTRKASIQRKTLWQQIADVLREDIIQGKIKPGERIVEEDIAEKFHVSRDRSEKPCVISGRKDLLFMSLIKAVQ